MRVNVASLDKPAGLKMALYNIFRPVELIKLHNFDQDKT